MSVAIPEHVEGTRDEKAAIIRRFILNAAPGELPQVLRSLKTLTRDDDLFLSVIPRFCNEYSMRQQVVYAHAADLKARHEIGRTGFQLMTTKHNHLPSLVRRFAKLAGVNKNDASAEVLSFFEASTIVSLSYDGGQLTGTDEVVSEPFAQLQHVYVGPVTLTGGRAALVVAEIDPVEGVLLRALVIDAKVRRDGDSLAALPPALRFIANTLLPPPRMADGPEPAVDQGSLLHEMQAVLEKHVAKSFCVSSSLGPGSSAASPSPSADKKQHPQEAGASTAVMVFPAPSGSSGGAEDGAGDGAGEQPSSGGGGITIAVTISSRHTNLRALWTGRWKAVYLVTLTPPEGAAFTSVVADGAASLPAAAAVGEWSMEVVGEAKVHVHYFEEGNVHMESTRVFPKQVLVLGTKAPGAAAGDDSVETQIAKKVVKQIKKEEAAFEAELQEACRCGAGSLGDEAIKSLRRRLPISRQLFDFSVDTSAHSRASWTRAD